MTESQPARQSRVVRAPHTPLTDCHRGVDPSPGMPDSARVPAGLEPGRFPEYTACKAE